MENDHVYDLLTEDMPENVTVLQTVRGATWTAATLSDGSMGVAMRIREDNVPRMFETLVGMSARKAARAVMSWNFEEAAEGMAVLNAWHNDPRRLPPSAQRYPYELACTRGWDVQGRTVGLVGHLRMADDALLGAKRVYILERRPQAGDYPDTACEFLLPKCDVVIITGSAFVNKTMPRLLALSAHARVILIGPTVPLHAGLLSLGAHRLCGMCVTHPQEMLDAIAAGPCPGYRFGDAYQIG